MHAADEHLHRLWITQRDAQAFRALTSRYCAMVYATCVRILRNPADAEDVTQECFIALARTPRGLTGPMGAWLHRVATYQALNRRRSEARRRIREERYAPQDAAAEGRWDEIAPLVDEAIDQLPEKIRVAVVAHFVEDVPVTAIAEREGVTHGAISQRIRKGVELIRERLREKGVVVAVTALSALLAQNASAAPAPAALVSSLGKLALSGSGRAAVSAPPLLSTQSLAVAASALIAAAALIGYAAQPALITAAEPAPVAAIAPEPTPVEPAASPQPEIAPAVAAEPPAASDPPVPADPEPATWREVVRAYAAHQDRIRRIAFDFDHAASGTYFYQSYAPQPGRREFFHRGSIVTDGDRCVLRYTRWGDWFGGDIVPAENAQVGIHAYNGDDYIGYLGTLNTPGLVQYHPAARQSTIKDSAFRDGRIYLLFARQPGGPLLGLPLDSGLRMEELLFSARSAQLRPEREEVNGAPCYVVDAHTAYGDFTVWFDPAKDFNIAQSVIVQDGGDVYEGVRLVKGGRTRYDYAAERMIQIDGLWVTAEASMRQSAALLKGNGHDYVHRYKRTNIRILPQGGDNDAYVLRAEDIPNGATLMEIGAVKKSGDPEWRWYDGEFVLTHDDGSQRRPSGKGRGFGGGMIAN